MADEVTTETQDAAAESEAAPSENERVEQTVEVSDAGPCRKHVRVTIARKEIERFFDKEFTELVREAQVPGFRPGKTPRKLIEKRFKKDVAQQVKSNLMLKSLEQIDEDDRVEPLSQPEIDFKSIDLPEEGDFSFEFDVEVRPQFDTPEYKGLAIKRPERDFSESDIDAGLADFLKRFATTEPKEGPIALGDIAACDIRFLRDKDVVQEMENVDITVDESLYFKDGRIEKFAAGVVGAKAGDSRELMVQLSDAVTREDMQGATLKAVFVIKEVKTRKLPEVNEDFLSRIGLEDKGALRDFIKDRLEAQLRHAQEDSTRSQVMEKIVESANWELPRDLLRRQAERSLQRKLLELESSGFSEDEIRARINVLRQNSVASTAVSLKQQFVLQKIAEAEEIKIEEEDLDTELRTLAARSGEPLRRVRARIEKEGLWETLALLALERKTIQKIIEHAKIEAAPFEPPALKGTGIDASAVAEEPEPPAESVEPTEA